MIEIRTTIRATTLTIGSWLGRKRLVKIQIGSVCWPAPIVKVVTMISSKESAKASRPRRRAPCAVGQRDVAERLPGVGPEVGRGLLERARDPAQPRDDVVVDDDDAEGGVADDHGEEAEVDAEDLREGVAERDAGDDAGQGDRQDDEERDRLAAEEPIARDGERGERAEQSAIAVATEADLDRGHERVAGAVVVERLANHCVVKLGAATRGSGAR